MADSGDAGAVGRFTEELDWVVFGFGAGLTLTFIVAYLLAPGAVGEALEVANTVFLEYINWAILLIVFLVVLFLLFLIVGPWGKIKLGDDPPEFSFLSFFAMLYSAGFAAGVVFWGPTEALFYYDDPNPLFGAEAGSSEAMTLAVQQTLFHWAIPQLAVFTIMGIAIGYFAYNYEKVPLRVSSILTPFIGADRLDGPLAKVVDIFAVFATIGGVATSLGFIGSQFVSGLDYQWNVDLGDTGIILVVIGMTLLFTISMVLGVNRGIRRLSNFNMVLFVGLMLATFVAGPTLFLVLLGTQAFGGMVSDFTAMSLYTGAGDGGTGWVDAWTVFYWAWALSWAPFAGLFIARISRGRSVREVAFTGIAATSAATIPWFTFVGGTAVWAQHNGIADFSEVLAGDVGPEASGFILFEVLQFSVDLGVVEFSIPVGSVLIFGFLILVTTFFVTSADSSTLAVSMMTTGGKAKPSNINRIFWGVMLGATAGILMVISEGVEGVGALQEAAVITGGPFAFVCLIALIGLVKEFSSSHGRVLLQDDSYIIGGQREQAPQQDVVPGDDD